MKKSGLILKGLNAPTSLLILGGFATGLTSLSGQSVLQEELDNRRDSIIAAEESLLAGDEAYQKAEFEEAVALYRGAYLQISEGTTTASLRGAARERYAQAAVQAARVMNRAGNRDGAIKLVDEVLSDSVHPAYQPALQFRAKLDDPITTNPSATPEHGRKIDEVRRLLYQAEGEYNLGKFDESYAVYEKVLRIDPYNKAARRGMERANAAVSDYARSAFDETRSTMLAEVASQWELNPPRDAGNLSVSPSGVVLEGNQGADINAKLDNITVPIVSFEEASLEEAVEYLEAKSRQLDPEIVEDNRGISFVLNMGSGKNSPEIDAILSKRFSLRLQNVPLREIVKYVAQQTGTAYSVDSYAVVFRPLTGTTDELITRQYSVPPTFLSQSSGSAAATGGNPFDEPSDSGSKLAPRLTARQYLEDTGVDFPEGASASYTSSLNQLTVRTTAAGHDIVSALVHAISSEEPIAVVVETKILRISQETLEELDFDVVLSSLEQSGDLRFDGGSVGNGLESNFENGNPVTSGLRSGDFATRGDALETLLDSGVAGSSAIANFSQASAPGVFSVIGDISDTGVGVLLGGMSQAKGVDLLVQPSVVTRNGEQATINSTRDIIYPTEYEPPQLPNQVGIIPVGDLDIIGDATTFPATPATPTAFETRAIGVTLEVQPTVSEDRSTVSLALAPRVQDFLGFVNYGTPVRSGSGIAGNSDFVELTANQILMPIFSSVSLNTTVEVANNRTILVGGLMSEAVEMVEDKVPILGDLPFLGRFFSSDVARRQKEVVMIFVTVRIVDPGGNTIQN